MSYSFGINGGNYNGYNISPGEGFGSSNMTNSLHHMVNTAIETYMQQMMMQLIMELLSNILQPQSQNFDLSSSNNSGQQQQNSCSCS